MILCTIRRSNQNLSIPTLLVRHYMQWVSSDSLRSNDIKPVFWLLLGSSKEVHYLDNLPLWLQVDLFQTQISYHKQLDCNEGVLKMEVNQLELLSGIRSVPVMVKEEEEDIITVLFFQRLCYWKGLGERVESVGLQVCLNLNVPHQTYL